MNIKSIIVALSLSSALLLTGCAGSDTTPAEIITVEQAPVEETQPTTLAFGETYTFDNGATVTLSSPKPYEASGLGAAGVVEGQDNLQVTITIVNSSDESFDFAGWPTATSGGKDASAIIDLANEVGDTQAGTLAAGEEVSWVEAFSVSDTEDLEITYKPSFLYDAVVFTSK